MIRSEQRGKETLGLLISEFESPKRSRRLAFINNKQRQMQRGLDLCLLLRPIPCPGCLASLGVCSRGSSTAWLGSGAGFVGVTKAGMHSCLCHTEVYRGHATVLRRSGASAP